MAGLPREGAGPASDVRLGLAPGFEAGPANPYCRPLNLNDFGDKLKKYYAMGYEFFYNYVNFGVSMMGY